MNTYSENTVRLTHVAKVTNKTGYYVRFSVFNGTPEAQNTWNFLRSLLKNEGHALARWLPEFKWKDGKSGAWWLSDDVMARYRQSFCNYVPAVAKCENYAVANGYQKETDTAQQPSLWSEPAAQAPRTAHKEAVVIPPHVRRSLETLGISTNEIPTKAAFKARYIPDHQANAEQAKAVLVAKQMVLAWIELRERVGSSWFK